MDEAERLYELRDGLDVEAQRLSAARDAVGAARGGDASGTVTVTLGEAVPVVVVGDGWRRQYAPHELSGAVVAAATAAATARLEQYHDVVDDDATYRPRPAPSYGDTAAGRTQQMFEDVGDRLDLGAVMDRFMSMLDTVADGMQETFEIISARGAARHDGVSGGGHVRVGLRGRALAEVQFDAAWLAIAAAAEISTEINAAIADATQRVDERTPSNPFFGTPLSGFQGVLEDPAVLGRYLLGQEDFAPDRTEGTRA